MACNGYQFGKECNNKAEYIDWRGVLYCDDCKKMTIKLRGDYEEDSFESVCSMCEYDSPKEFKVSHKFVYDFLDEVILTVDIIVLKCRNKKCKFKWTDWRAEKAQEKVVEEYVKSQKLLSRCGWCIETNQEECGCES